VRNKNKFILTSSLYSDSECLFKTNLHPYSNGDSFKNSYELFIELETNGCLCENQYASLDVPIFLVPILEINRNVVQFPEMNNPVELGQFKFEAKLVE
jgi:hypothetical protein